MTSCLFKGANAKMFLTNLILLNLQYVPKVNQHKNQRNETEVKAV